jgi:uncharacterized membrane protein YeaQ/YmgE (transglycosylase-associated protein family)
VRQLGAIFRASVPVTPRLALQAHVGVPLETSVGHGADESQGGGGSIVGGLIGGLIWKSSDGKFHPAGVILSILGAMLLLWGYNAFLR